MTTYNYSLTLNDSESIALEFWLDLLITECDAKISSGEWAPYYAYKDSFLSIKEKLKDATPNLTSTSSFCE